MAYVTGLLTFVAGLAIELSHNIWVPDWRLFITLFGWLALIKDAWLVIFPANAAKTANVFARNMKLVIIPWLIMLAIGIVLMFKGV